MAETNGDTLNETQLVTFVLAGEEFGAPITFVKEIVRVPDITRIPKAPHFVEGVANLRGNILPIVNLRERFDLPAGERTDDNRAVVVEMGGTPTGLVVDQVSEVIRIPNDIIEPPPPAVAGSVAAEYLKGVAKLRGGERLILLLDIEKVIPSDDRAVSAVRASAATDMQAQLQDQRRTLDEEQMVSFRVAGEEYALAIAEVQEIIRVPEITHVPGAPSFVEGVVALRNRLLPIVNLRTRFGVPAAQIDEDSRIVVVNLGGVMTGMQVDAVSEVLSVPNESIEPAPSIVSAGQADHLRGVAKLDQGRRLIMLLDVAKVLSSSEMSQLAEMGEQSEREDTDAEGSRRQALEEHQFVSFRVENEEFGVDIQQVQEIIWLPEITRVPRAPHFVEGIINLRGSVLPVIDMRKRFGIAEAAPTDSTSIVVVDVEGRKTGVIVDAVSEVLRLAAGAIEPPPPVVAGIDTSFVQGVGKLHGGQRMLIILDMAKVLSVDRVAAA